jgi:hypothetical protein
MFPVGKVLEGIEAAAKLIPVIKYLITKDPSVRETVRKTQDRCANDLRKLRQNVIYIKEIVSAKQINQQRSLNHIIQDYNVFSKLVPTSTWWQVREAKRGIADGCRSLEESLDDITAVLACTKEYRVVQSGELSGKSMRDAVKNLNLNKMDMPIKDLIDQLLKLIDKYAEELAGLGPRRPPPHQEHFDEDGSY